MNPLLGFFTEVDKRREFLSFHITTLQRYHREVRLHETSMLAKTKGFK